MDQGIAVALTRVRIIVLQVPPRLAWPNRVRFRYGLVILLRLLSTFPLGNAVTIGFRAVTLP